VCVRVNARPEHSSTRSLTSPSPSRNPTSIQATVTIPRLTAYTSPARATFLAPHQHGPTLASLIQLEAQPERARVQTSSQHQPAVPRATGGGGRQSDKSDWITRGGITFARALPGRPWRRSRDRGRSKGIRHHPTSTSLSGDRHLRRQSTN